MIPTLKHNVIKAWKAYTRLFYPISPSYAHWFRLMACFFAPMLMAPQLLVPALFDENGLTHDMVVSRILIGFGAAFACSVAAWLVYNAAWAWRSRA
ncbi:MAG: hypothetical protein WBW32_01230 [Luteibacter sp.]